MPCESEIGPIIRQYIQDNFIFRSGSEALLDNDSLMQRGLLDSMGVLEMVTFLETRFAIRIPDDEVLPQNLDSIGRLSAFVHRKVSLAANAIPETPRAS